MRVSGWDGVRWAVLGGAVGLVCAAAAPAVAPPPVAPPAVGRTVDVRHAPVPSVGGPGAAPVRLRIPVLRIDAPVRAVATGPAGDLGVPDDPQVIGWWAAGGAPGVPGAAGVLDGHVDSAAHGPGALFHLAALVPGDVVAVVTAQGAVVAYAVQEVHRFPKTAFRADLLTPGGAPRLVVVTCGGVFDRATRNYEDNVVVVAVPVS
ncbi:MULTISPECIES: class F sortase [unclassified Pseudonocardia]|uniref:class F sortase n=1 Tax=unclassified Pseudonocardia TaxID=2619320 RepID=UPI001ACC2CF1|nr:MULTISPECIES: class F sortase [unclassified Pseudonocardia]MBN9098543.1 class F sortase [Pseudonocardia sp.]